MYHIHAPGPENLFTWQFDLHIIASQTDVAANLDDKSMQVHARLQTFMVLT